ncbi:MAG TPA: hypothetical protein VFX16_16995 [Pseudonocardiaceae bacterium]|nr:hypothetical protein [Pseudonocardiaceae bacterium]
MKPIRSLEELAQPDKRSLMFGPGGMGRHPDAEAVSRWNQDLVFRIELSDAVPETTQKSFERLQETYLRGIFYYEQYTVAADMARLIAEQAIAERFLAFYEGLVTFVDTENVTHSIRPANFYDLQKDLSKHSRGGSEAQWRLKLRSGQTISFDGMLFSLFRWARAEGLLGGQGDRIRDGARVALRNFVAHPQYHLGSPMDALNAIADLARLINRLWGAPNPSVERQTVVITWTSQSTEWGNASDFQPNVFPESSNCAIVLADLDEPELSNFDPQYESTVHPAEYLWGPGTWEDAAQWLQNNPPKVDIVPIQDRLFLLRHHDKLLYLPRSPNVAAGISDAERSGTWYLLRADSPFPAFNHQRGVLSKTGGHSRRGECQCPVEVVGSGNWQRALDLCSEAGVKVTPQSVPDFRLPHAHMPRWNRILGDGQWEIEDTTSLET